MLKTLHLEYMFIGPELRDFLVAKASTLQEVHLRSCLAEIEDGMADDGLHWHELFDAISSAKPQKLRDFRISEERPAPLAKDKNDCDKYNSKVEAEDKDTVNQQIKEARETVEGSGKRVWPHVRVDDKYGMLFEDLEENFVSFREGRDQEAYERMLDIISRNGGVEAEVVEERDVKGPKPQGSQAP